MEVSGSRSQTRPYVESPAPGNGQNPTQRRLTSGQDFAWPMAPGLDGKTIDLRATPEHPHYLDHTATLLDPSRKFEWVAALNSDKRMILGYVFKRETTVSHLGAATRRIPRLCAAWNTAHNRMTCRGAEIITDGPMFGTPVYRWLRRNPRSNRTSCCFYARVPEGLQHVDDITLANGRIVIQDRRAQRQVTLAASERDYSDATPRATFKDRRR